MYFRDAKAKLEQAARIDYIVRRMFDTRRYIERVSGRTMPDEDFYAELAVRLLESRDEWRDSFTAHLDRCGPTQRLITRLTDERDRPHLCRALEREAEAGEIYLRHGGTQRPPSKLHPLVQQDEAMGRDMTRGDEGE